jgi:hypothetical protein
MRRLLVASSWVLAILAASHAGSATPERQHAVLDWRGPAACSGGVAVEREVERLLAGTKTSAPLEVHARVQALASGGYQLVLETTDAQDSRRFRRELTADSCEALIKPAAIVVALAIDPDAAARALRAPETDGDPKATESPSVYAAENEERAPVAPEPAKSAPTVTARAMPSPPLVPPERDQRSDGENAPRSERTGVAPFVRAAGVLDIGVLPAAAWGAQAAVGIRGRKWRAELGGLYLPPRRAVLEQEPEKGGDIYLIAATASGCFVSIDDQWELGACAGAEAGSAGGEGVGVDRPASGSTGWLAFRAGGLGGYRIDPRLAVELHAEAVARVGRSEFMLEELGSVHRPGPVSGRFDLGLRFGFE